MTWHQQWEFFREDPSLWVHLRREEIRDWFRRCPECGRRGYSTASPRWDNDRVAQMLGIAQFGCPCCGKGAIAERDAARGGTS